MSSDKKLWKSGKKNKEETISKEDENETLDLLVNAPVSKKIEDEIDLSKIEEAEEVDEDDNIRPVLNNVEDINLRKVGIVGIVVVLLLTGVLFLLVYEQKIEINVPNEKYGERISYDLSGSIDLHSDISAPLPIGFFGNDVVINKMDIKFKGELNVGITQANLLETDGYSEKHNVFKKYIEQHLNDVDGNITDEDDATTPFVDGEITTTQDKYIDSESLNIIRTDLESNASYSDALAGRTYWHWQNATEWIPNENSNGHFPHSTYYIGKTLKEGDRGKSSEGGVDFNWEVFDGGKVNDMNTALIRVSTSYIGEFLFHEYEYRYSFDLYVSESSTFPLKFNMALHAKAKPNHGEEIFAIDIEYQGIMKNLETGIIEIPINKSDTSSKQKMGEFKSWINGAPNFGNGSCGLDANFTLQKGIQKGRDDKLGDGSFASYLDDQKARNLPAFVIEADYTGRNGGNWNFTMAPYDPQESKSDAWNLKYNRTNISGNSDKVNRPIMSMEAIPEPLTVCSAEESMSNFSEISKWAVDKKTGHVNYSSVNLSLGQNLVSKQSLTTPTSIINLGTLNLLTIIRDINTGSFDPDDYSESIDVSTAGSYAYFLEHEGESEDMSYDYHELAGIDAKDGLVLFNLQSRSSLN